MSSLSVVRATDPGEKTSFEPTDEINLINLENINGASRDLFLSGHVLRHCHVTLLLSALTERL